MKNLKIKFLLLFFAFALLFANTSLFAEDSSDEVETASESSSESGFNDDSSSSDAGSENSGSESDSKSEDFSSDNLDENDDENSDEKDSSETDEKSEEVASGHGDGDNYTIDYGSHQEHLTYDDVYDSENNQIYHNDNEKLEDDVYDFFYDAWVAKTAESLAKHYSEAIEAYNNALKSNVDADIDSAKESLNKARDDLAQFCEEHKYTFENESVFVQVYDKDHKIVCRAGDPVIIALGKFVIDDNDIAISNGRLCFSLERHYVSNGSEYNMSANDYCERTCGALGSLWTSNLDTRISGAYNFLCENILEELKLYSEELSSAESLIAGYASEDSDCEPVLDEICQKIAENNEKIIFYETEAAELEKAKKYNRFVDYGKMGAFNGSLSSELVIYCDDSGNIIPFEKTEDFETGKYLEFLDSGISENSEIYIPLSSHLKNTVFIERKSSPGFLENRAESNESLEKANSETGFIVRFAESGEKRFYSLYGLPICFEYGNGESILFKYDENLFLSKVILDSSHYLDFSWNNGLLASVSDGSRKILYGYDGKNLASVTDFENDTKAFEYDDGGFLKKQIKADGSFISLEYEDKENEKVVSAVIDESGNAEHFAYDFENRKTVYTDSDGIPTIYFYDEKNRTTKVQYPDGSEENWSFDENGNRISWNNGRAFASYKYDAFGRLTEKKNEFGAEEFFSYSENHLVSHKNKFGVTEDYSYDDEGNLSAVYVDGSLLKSFSYRDGLVEKETDCRGNSFFYYYDEKSNLSKVKILENGKSSPVLLESYEYDSQNRVVKAASADGISKSYTYAGHKIIEDWSNSVRVTKVFSSRKLLLSEEIEDLLTGENLKKEYEYDKNRRCRAVYLSGKNSEKMETERFLFCEYNYTPAGKVSKETVWNFEQNLEGEKSGTEKSYSYDSAGNLCEIKKRRIRGNSALPPVSENEKTIALASRQIQSETSVSGTEVPGILITESYGNAEKSFAYDLRGNLLNENVCGTTVSSKEYSPSGMLVSEKIGAYGGRNYEYGAYGFLSSVCEENSVKSENSKVSYFPDGKIKEAVDAEGNKFSYEYNGLGMLTHVFSKFRKTEYEYDLCGKLISKRIKDENNRSIYEESWIYSDSGRKVFHKIGGKIVEKLLRNGFGLLKSKLDSVENSWIYSYDLLGRKISEMNPYGNITKFGWNENNLPCKITFPDGSFKEFFYDLDLNLIKVQDCAGKVLEYEYDDLNRLVSVWERPSAAPEKYEYDDFGRVTKVTKSGKVLLENSYDDSKKQITWKDAKGNVSFWNFDGEGRVLSSKNRNGDICGNEWNLDGKIKNSADFNGTKAFYEYGSGNSQCSVAYSSGGKAVFVFNAAGKLVSAENENLALLFEYDISGNLIYQKESGTGSEVYFDYADGKISGISCGSRKIRYEYGKCGEILKIIDKPGTENSAQTLEIAFEYDSCGREISRKWSTGESMRIFYDEAGREIFRTGFSASHGLIFAEGAVYDENGFKTLVLEPDFTVKRYEYDEFGRVKSASYPYSEEKAWYLKSCLENANVYSLEGSENFVYESVSASEYESLRKLCDLAGVSGLSSGLKKSIKESFEYDMNSNLVKRTTPYGSISYNYDKNDRLVLWGNGCSASYDANGNMISMNNGRKIVEMEYNASNRLEKATVKDFEKDAQSSVIYKYDALGRRISSFAENAGTTKISYIGKTLTELFSVFTPLDLNFSSTAKSDVRAGKMQAASRIRYKFIGEDDSETASDFFDSYDLEISAADSNSKYFQSKSAPLFSAGGEILSLSSENDNLSGNQFSFVTGNNGTVKSFTDAADVLSLLEYDEFGFPVSPQKSMYGFSGKRFDSRTGFYNFGFRDYLPVFGRFSSEDPALDGRNWYAYCAGDYVNFFDPDGLIMKKTDEQYMQDMGEALLGNSTYEKAKSQGCVVTTIAETLSALTGNMVSNSFINNDKSNFFGADGKGDRSNWGLINWEAIEENYNLEHKAFSITNVKTENGKNGGINEQPVAYAMRVLNSIDSMTALDVGTYINNIMLEQKETVVSLRVVYGSEKNEKNEVTEFLHFVVANGNVELINGKSYVSITPTSRGDKNAATNKYRSAVGWIERNGKIYVPVDNIRRIDTLSKAD